LRRARVLHPALALGPRSGREQVDSVAVGIVHEDPAVVVDDVHAQLLKVRACVAQRAVAVQLIARMLDAGHALAGRRQLQAIGLVIAGQAREAVLVGAQDQAELLTPARHRLAEIGDA
jgi:hypothetical protein